MKRAKLAVIALLMLVLGLAVIPAHAQVVPTGAWIWGYPQPSEFPNSWGWSWGHPIGSIYGAGPYGGFGYFNPYGVYEYSFHNPVRITGAMTGWIRPWY